MLIHQVPDHVVVLFRRRTGRTAVVRDREERRGACRPTARGERAQPPLRHEIEKRRRGHHVAPFEDGGAVQYVEIHLARLDMTIEARAADPEAVATWLELQA